MRVIKSADSHHRPGTGSMNLQARIPRLAGRGRKVTLVVRVICLVALATWVVQAQSPETEGVAASDGVHLSYRVLGDGRDTLVIVHGQAPGYVTDDYVRAFEPLASRYRLIFYDRRGNGRSTRLTDPELITVAKHVEDLEAVRHYHGLDKMFLLGESLGAGVAALYASAHPERIERLVLVAAIPVRHDIADLTAILTDRLGVADFQRLQRITDSLSEADNAVDLCAEGLRIRLRAYFFDAAAADRYASGQCVGGADAVKAAHQRQQLVTGAEITSLGRWNWRARLGQIRAPVLYIHPAFDLVDLAWALEYIKTVRDGRLVQIERSGHMPYFEQPDAFLAAVRSFLGGQWPSGAVVLPND